MKLTHEQLKLDSGGWFTTHTGRVIFIDKFTPDQVDLDEIAHSLSLICRFGGHCREYYTVAQHSVLVAKWLEERKCDALTVLAGLLHDSSEAYLGDVIRPLKKVLPGYQAIEDRFSLTIATKFNLPFPLPTIVKEADMAVFYQEVEDIKGDPPESPKIIPAGQSESKKMFLDYYDYISKRV